MPAVVICQQDKRSAEVGVGFAWLERERDRVSMILVGEFSMDCWLLIRSMSCEYTQHRWIVGKLVENGIWSDMKILKVKWARLSKANSQSSQFVFLVRPVLGRTVPIGPLPDRPMASPIWDNSGQIGKQQTTKQTRRTTPKTTKKTSKRKCKKTKDNSGGTSTIVRVLWFRHCRLMAGDVGTKTPLVPFLGIGWSCYLGI